jgi:hypothetical protein
MAVSLQFRKWLQYLVIFQYLTLILAKMTVCPGYKEYMPVFNILQARSGSINHERMRGFVKTLITMAASPVKLVEAFILPSGHDDSTCR